MTKKGQTFVSYIESAFSFTFNKQITLINIIPGYYVLISIEQKTIQTSLMIHNFGQQKLPLILLHIVRAMRDLPKASEEWGYVNKAIFSEMFEFKIH